MRAVQNPIAAEELRPDIRSYLEGWYAKAKARQERNGVRFDLSFVDFLQLWGKRRIKTLGKWMDEGSLYVRQRKSTKDDPNPYGYCLSWVSYAASQGGVMDSETAQIATRAKSLEDCRMKKGDRHTAAARGKISSKLAGVAKSEEHKGKISQTMTGMVRGPMSDAEKEKRRLAAKASWAAKKAAANRTK